MGLEQSHGLDQYKGDGWTVFVPGDEPTEILVELKTRDNYMDHQTTDITRSFTPSEALRFGQALIAAAGDAP